MPQFRKKPVVIDAWQWGSAYAMPEWLTVTRNVTLDKHCGAPPPGQVWLDGEYLFIGTLEGPHQANPGDWIIRGIEGEVYPCKPKIFEATYEAV